ncbi:MAG: SDR family NAD(P)-dependent oxidoreductase [Acidimicrobiales bacterium]
MNDAFGRPQTVLVLGGTSAIAQAVIDRLAGTTCRTVVLAGRDDDTLSRAAERATSAGAERTATVHFDALATEADDVVDRCFEAAGRAVDLVLVAVGALGPPKGDAADPKVVADLMTVNCTWPAAALVAMVHRLRVQGQGRVVVLSSVAAVRTRKNNLAYGAAKAGLDVFARGVAETLRGTAVVVQIVRLGFVRTKMTDGRRSPPFAVSVDQAADDIVAAMERGGAVVWSPPALRWFFTVARMLTLRQWWSLPGVSERNVMTM